MIVRTSALATTFFDSTSTSLDALSNAWRGIDLTQPQVQQTKGRVTAGAPLVAALWLDPANGRTIHQCHDNRILELWLGVHCHADAAGPAIFFGHCRQFQPLLGYGSLPHLWPHRFPL